MKTYMKYCLAAFCYLISLQCASQKKEIISKSTIKLEGKDTNIRDLIDIDGYYQNMDYSKIMLFEDGIYVDQFFFKQGLSKSEIQENMSKSLYCGVENKKKYWGFHWGVYKIVEDTIIVHHYLRGSWWTPWYADEIRYKIIDRTTIQPIYSRDLRQSEEQYYKEYNKSSWIKNGDVFYFTPAHSLPSSDCWLKEEKWIWRNESDWKAYMEKIKTDKKK